MDTDAAALGSAPPIHADSYMNPRPEGNESPVTDTLFIQYKLIINELLAFDKSKFLYHVNKVTNIHRLCISPLVVLDILTIAHREG